MCQMNVIVETDRQDGNVIENVTKLETTAGGINVSSLFEDVRFIPGVYVKSIDFSAGAVILSASRG